LNECVRCRRPIRSAVFLLYSKFRSGMTNTHFILHATNESQGLHDILAMITTNMHKTESAKLCINYTRNASCFLGINTIILRVETRDGES
jgi:hypothetical protein